MHTRACIRLISDQILDYFACDNFPLWNEPDSQIFKKMLATLSENEKLSPEMLKELFKNNQDLVEKIEFFDNKHFSLIKHYLKYHFNILECIHCRKITRTEKIETI